LAFRAVEAHSCEESLGFLDRAKVDLSAFIQDSDLVKTLRRMSY
jgi:hypothetical protein